MSITKDERCLEVEESIAEVLEGLAPQRLIDHIVECDHCRDLKYEAEQAQLALESTGADFRPDEGFADRMLAMVLEARPEGPQPSMSTSNVVPRNSGVSVTSAGAPASTAAPSSTDAVASAKTEFASTSEADSHATVLKAPTFDTILATPQNEAPQGDAPRAAGPTIPDPFVPTNKTVPLKAVLGESLTPMPRSEQAQSGQPVVEATTGRNHTGPRGATTQPPGATLPSASAPLSSAEPLRPTKPSVSATPSNVTPEKPRVVSLFRRKGFLLALAGGMAAAATVGGFLVRGHNNNTDAPQLAQEGVWSATVDKVTRASADGGSGLEICSDKCEPLLAGGKIAAGATIKTDAKTRARIKLSDDEWLAIDRNSEVVLPAGDTRQAKLLRGMVLADVKKVDGAEPAKLILPQGEVKIIGTKVAATVTDRRAAVEVVRGEVEVTSNAGGSVKVRAGEEATVSDRGEPVVAAKTTMSDVLEWSNESADDVDAPTLRGIGELRARKPGSQEERAGAVRLSKHNVKVRVVDVVARTEVDETFTNTTDEELEGVFRFPLPPGAQIENLALEVDGKLIDGAFVDRDRGAAIWRGVIQNAAPKAPRPREEIVWVPGPWRDPALLEWQRGGRFELKIFPIPKKGSRRVVLTYTQTVPQSAGVRRFTYPLVHDGTGNTKIDEFGMDVQLIGSDKDYGVETRGYQLAKADAAAGGERFTLNEKNFVPAGDLTMEYALPNKNQELTAWAYDMPASATIVNGPAPVSSNGNAGISKAAAQRTKDAAAEAKSIADDSSPFVALSVRPKLPRFPEGKERLHVIVVDSSRSMVGERYARATRLAASVVREMDRRDEFMVLACDTTCQIMGSSASRTIPLPSEPSAESAQQVESFLGSIEPDGGSNLLAAVQAARAAAGSGSGREVRVLYLGDGTPTVGPTKPSTIEAAVRHAMPNGDGSVISVALGADADTTSLAAMARGGNGVVVPYVPGQRVNAAAVDVLAAAYGSVLSDVEVVLPPGLNEVTPKRLDPVPAGGETFVLARMTSGKQVEGDVIVRGRVGKDRFEQRYPAKIVASSNAGNAFVPRLFAAAKIGELEAFGGADDRERIVALSQKFNVASRHTSLLVLESEAMFKAFGLNKDGVSTAFTGEQSAQSSSADADGDGDEADAAAGEDERTRSEEKASKGDIGGADKKKEARAFDDLESMSPADRPQAGGGFGSSRNAGPAATATAAPAAPPPAPATKAAPGKVAADPFAEPPSQPSWNRRPPQRMIPMRRVFDRKASFSTDRLLANDVAKALADAESSLKTTPDSRDKTIALYRALMASGRVGEALEVTARWSQRDALDADALLARADLAAMNGDRERSLRILSGLSDLRPGDKAVQKRLIAAFTQIGRPEVACQHRMALADLDAKDVTNVAAAARCSEDQGLATLSSAFIDGAPSESREAIRTAERTLKLNSAPAVGGDIRITASWNQPGDLDVALIDKNGKRFSWLGGANTQLISVSAKDAGASTSETLGFTNLGSGNYTIEVVRAQPSTNATPVSGELTITMPGGETRKVPFTLSGNRVEAGSLRVFFTSRLVPADSFGGWR